MQMLKSFSLLVVLVLISVATSSAQHHQLDTLKKNFDQYRNSHFTEKVYVHSDRESYLTGESIWFKVYVTDASFNKPTDLSKVAYIEIIDSDNTPVLQTKIALKDGNGAGALYLPATLTSDKYVMRAYTNWMKNFSEAYFFQKTVTIVNTFRKIEPLPTINASKLDVQFFPEGGNLVAGIESKVAFRVVNESGRGVKFNGTIRNHNQEIVGSFQPQKFGIGHFMFTPQPGVTYQATITDEQGRTSTHNFPKVYTSGYVLQVHDTASQLAIDVKGTATGKPVYLFIHSRNQVIAATYQFVLSGNTKFIIDKARLPEGVSHITVFDETLAPVCERLYFKQPTNLLTIKTTTDDQFYITRRRVKAVISAENQNKQPESGKFSVSVFQLDSLPSKKTNIEQYFWFSSDLHGNVESPEYYFSGSTPEITQATDNLMLTHGWRRFNWSDVLAKKSNISYLPEYRGHIIQGLVKDMSGNPARGVLTYLSAPGKKIRLYSSVSNQLGEVLFELQEFKGTTSVIMQNNFTRDSVYQISAVSPFAAKPITIIPEPFTLQASASENILERSVAMQAQDIFYDFRGTPPPNNDSTAFYGDADETYYLDTFTRFPVLEEVMREYVPGVWVRKRKDGFHFMVIDAINKSVFNETPLMLLDGVPFFDEDEIMNFSPLLIKKLEVVTKRYFVGPGNYSGIVSYRTYTNDLAGFPLNPKAIKLNYEGLQLQREFFTSRYESPRQRETRMPDQRTLLYWNPDVTTSSQGKVELEFYTSDLPGVYQIVVEGMTTDGKIGSSVTSFNVKPELN